MIMQLQERIMSVETFDSLAEEIDTLWAPNPETGFLPRKVPAAPEELAASNYPSLRAMGSVASKLGNMSDEDLERFVASLPDDPDVFFPVESACFCESATRAYVNLAAHLIHRPKFSSRKELPPCVSRPLWALSRYVKRPPSLTYASYVLANFTSPVRPRVPAHGFQIAQTPSGTRDEEWFVAVHLSVESAGGEVVEAIGIIEKALQDGDESLITKALEAVESCLVFAAKTMPTVREHLDPVIFKDDIRPLLYGHDQLRFRGVEGDPLVTYVGETGAQSGIIRAADAVLGVQHAEDMVSSMNRFLSCAPPIHQKFFGHASEIGKRLATSKCSFTVREARQSALTALARFRRAHLLVVSEYLVANGSTDLGTGGTHFRVWLQRLVDEAETAASQASQPS